MKGIPKKFLNVTWEIRMAPEGYFTLHLWSWEGHMTGNWRGRYELLGRCITESKLRDLPTMISMAETWCYRKRQNQTTFTVLFPHSFCRGANSATLAKPDHLNHCAGLKSN